MRVKIIAPKRKFAVFHVKIRKPRLENNLFSMSKLENEAATPSFSRAILENEAGGDFLFSNNRGSTVCMCVTVVSVYR